VAEPLSKSQQARLERIDGLELDSAKSAYETFGQPRSGPSAAQDLIAQLPELEVGRDAQDPRGELFRIGSLGAGGMGVVELAGQRALDREVAIKHPYGHASQSEIATLLHEARIAGRLEHPNIVPVHAIGRDPKLGPVVVMKRVRGHAWADDLERLDRGDPLALAAQVEVLVRVCDAVAYAHAERVVHRDLKPDNVLLGAFGEVYVVDWGLSVALDAPVDHEEEAIVGTPAYMAPEMVEGSAADVDERTDVYLLGATLYHVLFGEPPHSAGTATRALISAMRPLELPERGDLPAELLEICARACRLSPSERYPSVEALQGALRDYLHHRSAAQLAARALAELEQIGDAPAEAREELLDGARMRLRQSLELWPENPRAADGLRAADLARLRAFVERGALTAAEDVARRMGDAIPADLAEAIRALREEREAATAAAEHLDALRRDRALGTNSRSRQAMSLMLAAGFVVMVVYVYARRTGSEVSDAGFLLKLALAVNVGWMATVFALRRKLLSTFVNRAVIVGLSAAPVAVLLHRVGAWMQGHGGQEIAQTDLLIITIVTLVLSAIHRSFLVPTLVGAICWFTSLLIPEATRPLINFLPVFVAGSTYVVWRRLELMDQALVDRADES